MDGTHEGAATEEGGGELDPAEAVRILEQTRRQARLAFDPESPVVAVVVAGFFLIAYGTVWWSLRDAHPAVPALWSLAVFYGLFAVLGIVAGAANSRATAGVTLSVRARRQQFALGAAVGAAGVGAWVVEGALRHLGVSFEIVYGVFGPTMPLIALAGAFAGTLAVREKWLLLGVCIAIIGVASVSTFFGPAGAWGLTGLGSCLVVLIYAGALVARRRRA
jgi:hypothetical protein